MAAAPVLVYSPRALSADAGVALFAATLAFYASEENLRYLHRGGALRVERGDLVARQHCAPPPISPPRFCFDGMAVAYADLRDPLPAAYCCTRAARVLLLTPVFHARRCCRRFAWRASNAARIPTRVYRKDCIPQQRAAALVDVGYYYWLVIG